MMAGLATPPTRLLVTGQGPLEVEAEAVEAESGGAEALEAAEEGQK